MKKDIVIASIPFLHTSEPMMAPGYLKAIIEEAGYSAVALDLNIEFMRNLNTALKQGQRIHQKLVNIINYLHDPDQSDQLTQLFNDQELSEFIDKEIDYMVERILSYDPERVGLSLLTYTCQSFCKSLCIRLKQVAPNIEIVIGGCGIKHTLKQESNFFAEELKQQGLIDHFIIGDAERAIVEYMNGNFDYPGIDNDEWEQPKDLSKFPYPDYSDYNFDLYEDKVIPILDSQGCVRKCKFCDIIQHWQKFTFKKSSVTFDEMVHQSKKHGIYRFSMRSSLSNGNMNEFQSWLELVSDYNKTAPQDKKFSWAGYFIIRPKASHPEDMWEKLSETQGTLVVGLETVIDRSRWEIGKKFNNTDVDYHLHMGQKYNVPFQVLMMAANPGENLQDFEFTKQWFKDRLHYAGNPIKIISWTLATILPGTAWGESAKEGKFLVSASDDSNQYWREWSEKDSTVTSEQRVKHLNEMIEICRPFQTHFSVHREKQ